MVKIGNLFIHGHSRTGKVPWNKGKKLSEIHKQRLSESHKGEKNYLFGKHPLNEFKKGHKINNGRKLTEEHKRKCGDALRGKKHPNWQGGKSFEDYGIKFNNILKEKIRKKYNRKCIECGYSEKKLGYKLNVHHIDYNKKNNKETNLIPLCNSCHSQTNFDRLDWTTYFQNKSNGIT